VIGERELYALGSGGSNRLRNAILSVLSHVLDHGASLEEAVNAPRIHLERSGDPAGRKLAFERAGLNSAALAALRALPDTLVEFPARSMYFGGVHLAARDEGGFAGVGDPRRGGSVATV
jgi:gamma-glutamyltranspeptidase/glutathione hydrolase